MLKRSSLALAVVALAVITASVFMWSGGDDASGVRAAPSASPSTSGTPDEAVSVGEEKFAEDEAFENARPLPPQEEPEAPAANASPVKPAPAKTVPVAGTNQGSSTGCHPSYGPEGTVCLPLTMPSYLKDGCEWLTAYKIKNVQVTGPDDLGLDPDENGVACD